MSAAPKVIEGTWDDVVKHAAELAGHRLRVTVIDDVTIPYDHPAFDQSPEAIEAWVKRFHEYATNRPELRLADDALESLYNEQLDHQL